MPQKSTEANSAATGQKLQNVASDLGIHCINHSNFYKKWVKRMIPDTHKIMTGLIQLIQIKDYMTVQYSSTEMFRNSFNFFL